MKFRVQGVEVAAVERIWHISHSQGLGLALAFR